MAVNEEVCSAVLRREGLVGARLCIRREDARADELRVRELLSSSVGSPASVTGIRVASWLLRLRCGLWWRGERRRSCQLGVEQKQQRFVVREQHPVDLPGVTPNLCGESDVVGGLGGESLVGGERLVP